MIKAACNELVAYLPVELMVERFVGAAIKPDHLERYDRAPASLLVLRLRSQATIRGEVGLRDFIEVGPVAFA